MATVGAQAGEIVNLETWAKDLNTDKTKAIVKTDQMELIRLVFSVGRSIPHP